MSYPKSLRASKEQKDPTECKALVGTDARIVRGFGIGLAMRLLGRSVFGLDSSKTGVLVRGSTERRITFSEITAPATIKKSLGISTITLPLAGGETVTLSGAPSRKAVHFIDSLNASWFNSLRELIDCIDEDLRALSSGIAQLKKPESYPAACRFQRYYEPAKSLLDRIPSPLPDGIADPEQTQMIQTISEFLLSPHERRESAIEAFVGPEIEAMKNFLDTIEANPLTPEQRLSVVTDEDATLVLAGAGSGKTSVIVAKAAYLIERNVRHPDEILLMAFNRNAAKEMATRIEERCGQPVDAKTFHALGMQIIGQVEGQGPRLAPHADDDVVFRSLLREIVRELAVNSVEARDLLITWFFDLFQPYRSEWDFETLDQYYRYVETQDLRTLKGDRVKSFEELEIANWLYLNGIDYEYEPVYEHPLPKNSKKVYQPDFLLTESGVYIEHFGVRRKQDSAGKLRLTTAPSVDTEKYLEGMAWKRTVHEENNTSLIETYSYEKVEDRLLSGLEEKLKPYVTPSPIPPDQIFDELDKLKLADAFTQTLGTFLRLFKSGQKSVKDCTARAEQLAKNDRNRNLSFLQIFELVYEEYQIRLKGMIDFEDMVVRATDHVRSKRYLSPYRHILVDEFQDISEGRAELVKALKAQHEDARVFAVGDDWQSIYRFTGSDIHLMRDFGKEFGGNFANNAAVHKTVDLGRTFRSVDKIALPARTFILKNPLQLEKKVIPAGTTAEPAVRIDFYTRANEAVLLDRTLGRLARAAHDAGPSKRSTVLILGRYKFLKPENLRQLQKAYPNLSIEFKTIHSSKGLEADHVLILGAEAAQLGLPSEIVDDSVLDLVLPDAEVYDHAEERRLFYVALTRARYSVTIHASETKPSVFVRELIEDESYEVDVIGNTRRVKRRCGECGGQLVERRTQEERTWYLCEHTQLCGAKLPACEVCEASLPIPDQENPGFMSCECGARFPICPACNDAWLVERKGRYGKFLSCVRYPDCDGKSKKSGKQRKSRSNSPSRNRQSKNPRRKEGSFGNENIEIVRSMFKNAVKAANSWDELQTKLRTEKYELAPRGGGLILRSISDPSNTHKASELGYAYSKLIKKYEAGFPGHSHTWLVERVLNKSN